MFNMLTDCAFDVVDTGHAAGQTQVISSSVNCTGYDGVLFIVNVGAVTAGAVMTAQAQDATTSGGSFGNVGSAATVTDSGGATSNGILVVEVLNAQKGFVQCVFTRTTSNVVVNSIVAIRYRSKNRPVVQGATVVAQATSNATA